MRRVLIATGAAFAFAFASAAPASAHHGRHHRHHHKHHVHFVTFASQTGTAPSTTTSSDEGVGKVASFTNGVLTITLADGSTVSGKVTDATEIETRQANDQDQNDNNNDFGDEHHGDHGHSFGDDERGDGPNFGHFDDGNGEHDCDGGSSSSGTSALVPGATVGEAELKLISGMGAFWEKVEILS